MQFDDSTTGDFHQSCDQGRKSLKIDGVPELEPLCDLHSKDDKQVNLAVDPALVTIQWKIQGSQREVRLDVFSFSASDNPFQHATENHNEDSQNHLG